MESAAEDGGVGFDFQILHQSGAAGESLGSVGASLGMTKSGKLRPDSVLSRLHPPPASVPPSQTEGDGYHQEATASRGNMILWRS